MPAHNAAPYIGEALDSILGQTCRDFELLVVDDGSTDDTAQRVADRADARIRLIRLETNQGRATARNVALENARGAYLAWMDADDIAVPRRLEKQLAFLESHPDVAVCGGWLQYFHQSAALERFPRTPEDIRAATVFGSSVPNPCVCLRLDAVRVHSPRYDPALERAEDFAFWGDLLLGAGQRAANLPEVLLHYRYVRRPFVPRWHVRALLGHIFPHLGLEADAAEAALHAGLVYAPLKRIAPARAQCRCWPGWTSSGAPGPYPLGMTRPCGVIFFFLREKSFPWLRTRRRRPLFSAAWT